MTDRKKQVYLDNIATMPVDARVIEAMLPFYGDTFGNPVSIHHLGEQVDNAVETARIEVAGLLNAKMEEMNGNIFRWL